MVNIELITDSDTAMMIAFRDEGRWFLNVDTFNDGGQAVEAELTLNLKQAKILHAALGEFIKLSDAA